MKRLVAALRVLVPSLLVALVTVGLPALALAASAGHEGGATPHVNWWHWSMEAPPVGWYFIDFAVFIGVLVYFGRKPFKAVFVRRHQVIQKAVAENEAAFARAQAAYNEAREKLAAVDREVTVLMTRIKEEGVLERDRVVAAARTYVERTRGEVATLVKHEAEGSRERLRDEIARTVLARAEAILTKELTAQDRARLLDAAISELENEASEADVLELRPAPGRPAAGGAAVGGVK